MCEHGVMGFLDRFKDIAAAPAPQVHDGDELPPWLREAIPSPNRATNPPPAGVVLHTGDDAAADPYRRAPARGAGLVTRTTPAAAAPPEPVDMSSARAFSPPPPAPPASEYTPPATVYVPQGQPAPASPPVAASPPAAANPPAAAASPAPAPAPAPAPPAHMPPAQRAWFAKTLPPGQDGGPVPWFARQEAGPASPAPTSPAPTPLPPAALGRAYAPPPASPPPPAPYAPPPPPAAPAPVPAAYAPPPRPPSTGHPVDKLIALVLENWRSYPFEQETLSLLQMGLPYLTQRDCSKDAILAGQTAARLGYIARAAEYSEHPPARRNDEDLAQELLEYLEAADESVPMASGMAEFAADLAVSEPVDPPASDGGPSWSVPGIDGSSRGRLREQLLKGVPCPPDITRQNLQQTWKYGYFLRCTEEFFFDG